MFEFLTNRQRAFLNDQREQELRNLWALSTKLAMQAAGNGSKPDENFPYYRHGQVVYFPGDKEQGITSKVGFMDAATRQPVYVTEHRPDIKKTVPLDERTVEEATNILKKLAFPRIYGAFTNG